MFAIATSNFLTRAHPSNVCCTDSGVTGGRLHPPLITQLLLCIIWSTQAHFITSVLIRPLKGKSYNMTQHSFKSTHSNLCLLSWSILWCCWLSDPSGADLTIAFLLLLLLLLLQSLSRSSIKHQYFHDSSVGFNISYMVGKRTAPGFIWRWQRQRHTQRQIQGQRQAHRRKRAPKRTKVD